jgi:hypothetical protein
MALTVNQKFGAIVLGVVVVSVLVSCVYVSTCPVVFYDECAFLQPPLDTGTFAADAVFYMDPIPVSGVYLSPEVFCPQNLTTCTVPASSSYLFVFVEPLKPAITYNASAISPGKC